MARSRTSLRSAGLCALALGSLLGGLALVAPPRPSTAVAFPDPALPNASSEANDRRRAAETRRLLPPAPLPAHEVAQPAVTPEPEPTTPPVVREQGQESVDGPSGDVAPEPVGPAPGEAPIR